MLIAYLCTRFSNRVKNYIKLLIMAMNFKEGRWNHEINVTDFVKTNITPYEGDASFWQVLLNVQKLYGISVWRL